MKSTDPVAAIQQVREIAFLKVELAKAIQEKDKAAVRDFSRVEGAALTSENCRSHTEN